MQLLDAGQQVTSRPAPNALVLPGWANNAPASSPPTIADPDAWNAMMAEMLSVIAGTGGILSKANVSQLLQAMLVLAGARGAAGLTGGAPGGGVSASWTFGGNVLAFNGGTTGAGGMDTGSVPASGDLSVYAIYDPATNAWAALGCLGATSHGAVYAGAHMPAGYTASALIWVGKTDGSSHIVAFQQSGRTVYVPSQLLVSGISTTSWTALSLASFLPPAATAVGGGFLNITGGGLQIAGDSTGIYGYQQVGTTTGGQATAPFRTPLLTAQTVWYATTGGGSTAGEIQSANYEF